MVLYQNNFITLDFDPANDLLFLDWPGIQKLFVPEVMHEAKVVLDTIKHYDVKKLLIDTSKAVIDIENKDYADFVMAFIRELKKSRLQKFARIGTGTPYRENIIKKAIEASRITLQIDYKIFTNKEDAISWLTL